MKEYKILMNNSKVATYTQHDNGIYQANITDSLGVCESACTAKTVNDVMKWVDKHDI